MAYFAGVCLAANKKSLDPHIAMNELTTSAGVAFTSYDLHDEQLIQLVALSMKVCIYSREIVSHHV